MKTERSKLLSSELVKLLTLRSVWVTGLVTVGICITMSVLTAPSIGEAIAVNDPALAAGTTPELVSLEWVNMGLVGIIVIGVVAGSSEYVGDQIKISLLAVPNRMTLITVKSFALLLFTFALAIITIPTLSLLSQLTLGDLSVINKGIPTSLIWKWIGGIIYWVAMAQISFSFGILARQALIPLFVLIVVSQLVGPLLYFLPFLMKYLPVSAGAQLVDTSIVADNQNGALTPVMTFIVLFVWVVVIFGMAAFRFCRKENVA